MDVNGVMVMLCENSKKNFGDGSGWIGTEN